MANENENPKYDPEIEKQAIAAEESYKRANGHYRESSAYNKAQQENAKEKNNIGTQYDPEIEKQAIQAEENYRKAHGHYRESSAYNKAKSGIGVRRDLNGNELGEYKMHNSGK